MREYGVDSHLLLAVETLYFCSEVCIGVGGFKSQLFSKKHQPHLANLHVIVHIDRS